MSPRPSNLIRVMPAKEARRGCMTIDAAIMRPRVAPVGDWHAGRTTQAAVSEGRIRGRSPAQNADGASTQFGN